jgi:hypothetical protein
MNDAIRAMIDNGKCWNMFLLLLTGDEGCNGDATTSMFV